MCLCSATRVSHRFCGTPLYEDPPRDPQGNPLPFRDEQGRLRPAKIVGHCRHPKFVPGAPPYSTMHPETGAWLEAHAEEVEPRPKPPAIDPTVASHVLGNTIQDLEAVVTILKAARDGTIAAPALALATKNIENSMALVAGRSGTTHRSDCADSVTHHGTTWAALESVGRILTQVNTELSSKPPPTSDALHRLAHMVETRALPLAKQAVIGFTTEPPDGQRALPHASHHRPGDPA